MTYRVTASRWSGGWELDIDGVGVTQARTLDTAERMVRDYLRLEDVGDWEIVPLELDLDLGGIEEDVHEARRLTRQAIEAQTHAAAFSRKIADALRHEGLSVSDTAFVLGVSRGRVSQLTRSKR